MLIINTKDLIRQFTVLASIQGIYLCMKIWDTYYLKEFVNDGLKSSILIYPMILISAFVCFSVFNFSSQITARYKKSKIKKSYIISGGMNLHIVFYVSFFLISILYFNLFVIDLVDNYYFSYFFYIELFSVFYLTRTTPFTHILATEEKNNYLLNISLISISIDLSVDMISLYIFGPESDFLLFMMSVGTILSITFKYFMINRKAKKYILKKYFILSFKSIEKSWLKNKNAIIDSLQDYTAIFLMFYILNNFSTFGLDSLRVIVTYEALGFTLFTILARGIATQVAKIKYPASENLFYRTYIVSFYKKYMAFSILFFLILSPPMIFLVNTNDSSSGILIYLILFFVMIFSMGIGILSSAAIKFQLNFKMDLQSNLIASWIFLIPSAFIIVEFFHSEAALAFMLSTSIYWLSRLGIIYSLVSLHKIRKMNNEFSR